MKNELLSIKNLSAGTEEREILHDISLCINKGEVHVLMGSNGSGKSTLASVLMNSPGYVVSKGDIFFEGELINDLSTDKRAKKGLFLSFQKPYSVSGVSVENFIRQALNNIKEETVSVMKFHNELIKEMDMLSFDRSYAQRYLNDGFSGGEMKKNEILQMLMLKPKLAILDETDSGLDVDATRIVSEGIKRYLSPDNSVLIITHHRELLKGLPIDGVHVLIDGRIVKEGDASLVHKIEEEGFSWIKEEAIR